MIELMIYHLHLMGVLYAAVSRWQREGMKGALLAIGICGLVFVIGWSLTGAIARMLMPGPFAPGALVTSDTLSLLILLVPEVAFFWMFFVREPQAA